MYATEINFFIFFYSKGLYNVYYVSNIDEIASSVVEDCKLRAKFLQNVIDRFQSAGCSNCRKDTAIVFPQTQP